MKFRPHRSVLYLPASNRRAIEKAKTLACDAVILDLEDAVVPDSKDLARAEAVAAVKAGGFGRRQVIVRINALNTPWGEADLLEVAATGPDAILVPKVNDKEDILRYNRRLDAAPAHTKLWAMVETCHILFHLHSVASAVSSSRLTTFILGTNDLAKETGARLTPERPGLWMALSSAVAAARAYGLTVVDGVFNDLENITDFERQCYQAAEFGFDGKTLIYPNQIDIANKVFAPGEEDVTFARAVIAAFQLPESAKLGALRVEGRMVERLHLAQAEKTVAIFEAIREI